jgi:hypothetical protein
MWEIISFGDPSTLNMTMNAIASIFGDGGYKAAAAAIALFTVIGSTIHSLGEGKQELPFGRLIAGVIIYVMGFGTLTSVSIENRYDGTVTQIDNVPVAVAVPASLISNIGLYFTETMETAFGSPNSLSRISSSGYLAPMKVLASYRTAGMLDCPSGETASTGAGINLCKSLSYYIAECAMIKATRDNSYLSMREEDALSSIEFNSAAHATQIVNESGSVETLSCTDAYTRIAAAFNGPTFDSMVATNNYLSGVRLGEDGFIRTGDALEAIAADSGKARNFLINQYIDGARGKGELAYYYKTGSTDLAENLQSSIEQRNYGWTVQGEMFVQIVDKFIAIVESLIYGVAPFIGLMVLTGAVGAKTFMLYIQVLAIIQLIPALLVVTQNILMKDLEATQIMLAARYDVGSKEYGDLLTSKVKELMGMGGMLSATVVPALAMAFVTGSGMAVMGAFKGIAAPAKDTDATPDISNQGGSIQNLGNMNTADVNRYNQAISKSTYGALGDVTRNLSNSNSVSDAKKDVAQANQAYQSTLSNVKQSSQDHNWSSSDFMRAGQSITSGSQTIDSWADKQVQSVAGSGEWSTSTTNAVKSALVASASMGLDVLGNSAVVGGAGEEAYQFGDAKINKDSWQKMVGGEKLSQLTASYQDAKEIAQGNDEKITTSNSDMDSQIKKVDAAYSQVTSAQEEYATTEKLDSLLSLSNSDMPTFLESTGNNKSVLDDIRRKTDDWRENDKNKWAIYTQNLDESEGGINANKMDKDTAMLSAFMMTNNFLGDDRDTLETLSLHSGNSPTSSSELKDSPLSPTSGVTPITPANLESDINNMIPVGSEPVPTHLNGNFEEQQKQILADHSAKVTAVNTAGKSGESEFNTSKNEIESRQIVAFKNTQEAGKSIGDYLRTDEAKTGENGNLLGQISQAGDIVKDAYNETKQSFNESTVGKAVNGTINEVSDAYTNLKSYLVENGYSDSNKSYSEGFQDFLKDTGKEVDDILNSLGFNIGDGNEKPVAETNSNDVTMGIPR